MLAFVPNIFDAYDQIRRRLRLTLQRLVAFADRDGRCWPSTRTLAELEGIGKSTAARHLSELVKAGAVSRRREKRPGGGWRFVYIVAAQFLPAARHRSGVPKPARAVSQKARTEENTLKNKEGLPEDFRKWEPRLRAWRHSGGKFWNAFWGPKPSEPGCFAPADLIKGAG